MKKNVLLCSALSLFGLFKINAQVTKLSDKTALHGFTVNNKPILISDVDNSLWTTDGTPGGTKKLTSKVLADQTVTGIKWNGKYYFAGTSETTGSELWVTDGTDAGTMLIKDIHPGTGGSDIGSFIVYDNKLFFFAADDLHGKEPWITDGTAEGTRLVADINPSGGSFVRAQTYTIFKNNLYFVANDGTNGNEVWKSNGTAEGTSMLKNINPTGNGIYSSTSFINYGNVFLFTASTDEYSGYLWKSDGTETGTVAVSIAPNFPGAYVLCNNKVIFTVNENYFESNLWVTDATANGTKIVNPDNGTTMTYFDRSAFVNDKLAYLGYNDYVGFRIWVTDGTSDGTHPLTGFETNPNINFLRIHTEDGIKTSLNGKVYFWANDNKNGYQLWSTDGTVAGTSLLKKLYGDNGSLLIFNQMPYSCAVGNTLYFATAEQGGAKKIDIWKTDGTAAGTSNMATIDRSDSKNFQAIYTSLEFGYNNSIYLGIKDGDQNSDLYKLEETTLPVSLLSFNGALKSKAVNLEWRTATEINTSHFMLERSVDGTHFEDIAKLKAAGYSTVQQNYVYADAKALLTGAATLYYRLKMFDKDGSFKYSRLVNIYLKNAVAGVSLSPNPVKDILTLMFAGAVDENITLRVTDISGKLRLTQPISKNSNQYKLNISVLPAGIYYLQVVGSNQTKTIRFVK